LDHIYQEHNTWFFLSLALGAQIGFDVILPDIRSLTDPHLVTIGNHVRLSTCAYIQVN